MLKFHYFVFNYLVLFYHFSNIFAWSTEDLELFDLVESTSQNFYDVLGVDKKASASDIRKAYRKLSTLYHPDKNKNSDAEETFRKIAAIADVLRNDERRKTYDLILQTGLPDWRMPIYYYRRVRNMGLMELTIFLFCLATLGQYLFAWSVYWEKKYEIEEVVLSRLRKKAKHQRKGKNFKLEDDLAASEEICNLPKPRCQDLFPVRFFYFFIHLVASLPSYIVMFKDIIKFRHSDTVEEINDDKQEVRMKIRKHVKPQIPDYSNLPNYDNSSEEKIHNNLQDTMQANVKKKWSLEHLSESDILEFKKTLKKYPNGTLQRWEKVAACLDCSVSEVVLMVKQLKNCQISKNVPLSMQGLTGAEKENCGSELYKEKNCNAENQISSKSFENYVHINSNQGNGNLNDGSHINNEKIWKQDEQRLLELALQKYPKDTLARWDKVATYVGSKTKEECIERYKILVQQVRKKKFENVSK